MAGVSAVVSVEIPEAEEPTEQQQQEEAAASPLSTFSVAQTNRIIVLRLSREREDSARVQYGSRGS